MAQQGQNNVFVKERISQESDSINQVWASMDWTHAKKIGKLTLIEIILLSQIQGLMCSYIHSNLSQYKMFLLSFSFPDYLPYFHGGLSLI